MNQSKLIYFATVLFLALLLRVGAACYWQSGLDQDGLRFKFGDSDTYWVLSEKLSRGEPYEYGGRDSRAFRAPAYPLFLAPIQIISRTIFGSSSAIFLARLSGCVLGVATIAMLMWATFNLLDRSPSSLSRLASRASLMCGVFASLYPGAIGMSIFILSEALFCPCLVLSLMAWNQGDSPPIKSKSFYRGFWSIVLSGVAFGLACLSRPSWSLWPLMLVTMIFVTQVAKGWGIASRRYIVLLAIFATSTALTMSPWWIRNYLVFDTFVPTTLQVGASLYDGLHPGATGASDEGMHFTLDSEIVLREEDRKGPSPVPFEVRLNRMLFEKAIRWAWENPYATAGLGLIKFQKMWTPWPTAKELGGSGVRIAEAIGYMTIVGLAIIGFYAVDRQLRWPMLIYASPVFYFAVLHTIFVGSVRYRQPAILVLTIVAGIGAAWMLDQLELHLKRRQAT